MRYRLVYVNRLKEPPTQATTRGILIHAVLEHLFDLPAHERTPQVAHDLVSPTLAALFGDDPTFPALFPAEDDRRAWEASVHALIDSYFVTENPTRLEPFVREQLMETEVGDGIAIRGYIDRVDRAPNGALRVVDYKTGKSPKPQYQDDKLRQMRFYSLLLSASGYPMPACTRLIFLADGRILDWQPDDQTMRAFVNQVSDTVDDIERALDTGTFRTIRQPLCRWCGVQQYCPLFSPGALPEITDNDAEYARSIRRVPRC